MHSDVMAAGGTLPAPLLGVGRLPRCRDQAGREWPAWDLHADVAEALWLVARRAHGDPPRCCPRR